MEIRHATHPDDALNLEYQERKDRFVASSLFEADKVNLVYSHEDRMIVGGAVPSPGSPLPLPNPDELRADFFCMRRELAVVSIGAPAKVSVDGNEYALDYRDVLYIGRGVKEVVFYSDEEGADMFLASAISHTTWPTRLVKYEDADLSDAGSPETSNVRTIAKHLHEDGEVQTSQLVLGITSPVSGSVWNSMPPHIHDRRTEIYCYFGLPKGHRVQHFMGKADQPVAMTLTNKDTVISPSWSMHFGVGTTNYEFIWVMAGENKAFTDMDQVTITDLGESKCCDC